MTEAFEHAIRCALQMEPPFNDLDGDERQARIASVKRTISDALERSDPRQAVTRFELADELCDAVEPRTIAGETEAPAFFDSSPEVQEYWLALADVALAMINPRLGEGMVVVPREPTLEMVIAAERCDAEDIWRAMISAAPPPERVQPVGEVESVRATLTEIAEAYDKWDPQARFASTALFVCSVKAKEALAALNAPTSGEGSASPSTDAARMREAIRDEVINSPETADFMAGVPLEAAHQRDRWGAEHDAGKAPLDWFWLIGYLAQKAATAQIAGDTNKALHHTISTAAALANWHAAISGTDTRMRPGIDPAALQPAEGSDGE
jgi:hypothetical protein